MGSQSGCATRTTLDPDGVSVIRTYQFSSTVADPQPAWNPANYQVVVRSLGGFGLMQEGQGRQEYFESRENRPTFYPVWLNRDQFVFGPQRNVSSVSDGRVVAATDGLTIVAVVDNGLKSSVERAPFAATGYRPRVGGMSVYAQVEDKMIVVNRDGRTSDAGEGFYPEPQSIGEGICWQETPVFEIDRWTGKPPRGRLFIRWSPGQVTEIPGGCEARWTPQGGVVCTVLRGDPGPTEWWSGGTDVVFIENGASAARLIAKDARSPAPHPREPLVAVADAANGVRLVSLREPQASERLLTATGSGPRWSFDGLRLMTIESRSSNPGATGAANTGANANDVPAVMMIYVLKVSPGTL